MTQTTSPVVAITGAGRGIGHACALAFAAAGYDVSMGARSVNAMEGNATEIAGLGQSALVQRVDLTVDDDVSDFAEATIERFGRVDALINNSGIAGPSTVLWEMSPEDWDTTFAVNTRGVFLSCRAFLPPMIDARRGGSIVTIGSTTGKYPMYARSVYAATKAALIGLTRTLATETGQYGIRTNLITPGAVTGARLEAVISGMARQERRSGEEIRGDFETRSPLGRLTTPEDIASAAVFLSSPNAAAITGHDLNVNSGIAMF